MAAGARQKPGLPDFIISALDAVVPGSPQKSELETDLRAGNILRNTLGVYTKGRSWGEGVMKKLQQRSSGPTGVLELGWSF